MSIREVWATYRSLPRVAYLLSLGTFVNKAGSFFIVFLTLYLSESLGFDKVYATRCMGVFGLGGVIASLVGGQLADQFGRRRVMLFSLVGGSAALMVLSTLRDEMSIAVGIFVFALIVEMYRPAAAAMMADVVPPEQRNLAFGVLYVATNLGFAFGASVGGWIAEHVSFAWLFYGDAATTFLFAIWIAFVIPESLKRRAKKGDASDPSPSVSFGKAWSTIGRDWTFLAFCLAALMSGLVFFQGMSTLPLYLDTVGIPKDVYGWLISSNGLMIAIFQLPYGTFLSRFRRIGVIASGTFFVALGFGLVRFVETPVAILATILIWTIGEMMQAPFMAATVATLAPTELRARYQGVFSMCFGAAITLGAPLGGVVLEEHGGHTLWVGCAVVAGASGMIFLGISRGVSKRETGDGVKESP